MGKCPINKSDVPTEMHARPKSDLNRNRTMLARKFCQATDRHTPLCSTCEMMMITQNKVRKDALQLSLCNTELRHEKIVSALADNNKGALTNCSSERRIAIIETAVDIMAMKINNAVKSHKI